MSACNHSDAEHEAMRTDDATWSTLEPIGYQPGNDTFGDLELRNADCGSTLARRCMLTHEQREELRAAARAKHDEFRRLVEAAMERVAA
jgi:hypothetical protein